MFWVSIAKSAVVRIVFWKTLKTPQILVFTSFFDELINMWKQHANVYTSADTTHKNAVFILLVVEYVVGMNVAVQIEGMTIPMDGIIL